MRSRDALLLAAALVVLAAPARADERGWYVGGAGGWSKLAPMGSSDSGLNFTSEETHGFAALGFLGYQFNDIFSAEGEAGYRHHDVSSLTVINDGGLGAKLGTGSLNGKGANAGGTVTAMSFMLNGYANLLPGWRVSPYIGAGVGAAHLQLNKLSVANTTIVDDSDTRLAGQGIAGVAARLSPRVTLAVDYRYFLTVDPSFKDESGAPFHTKYRDQNVLLRVTFHFGAPPPPAPPPPVPAAAPMAPAPLPPAPVAAPPPPPVPAKLFLVFFGFDKATLTPEAAKVVEQAAAAYKSAGVASIRVGGYTDSVGTVAYNLKLSRRRADTVRAYLLKLGVPAAAIDEKWFGKADQRVPTADGVREPQNRRVEIVLP
jgi:OmpA-OmpF porin, OOP family